MEKIKLQDRKTKLVFLFCFLITLKSITKDDIMKSHQRKK